MHLNTYVCIYTHIGTYAYSSKAGWFVDKWGIGKNIVDGFVYAIFGTSASHKHGEKSINALHWQKNPKH